MKKIKFILSVMLMFSIVLSFTACGGGGGSSDSKGDPLKGKWEGVSIGDDMKTTFTFDGKGKCKMENEFGLKSDGTYTVDGSSLTVALEIWDNDQSFTFEKNDSDLTLTNDEDHRPSYELKKK